MNANKLIEKIKNETIIYALLTQSIKTNRRQIVVDLFKILKQLNANDFTEILSKYKNFADVFSNKQARELPEHQLDDHAIDIEIARPMFLAFLRSKELCSSLSLKRWRKSCLASTRIMTLIFFFIV